MPRRPYSQARSPIAYDKIHDYPFPRLYAAVAMLKVHQNGAEATELAALGTVPSSLWPAGHAGEMQLVRRVSLAAAKVDAVPVIVA